MRLAARLRVLAGLLACLAATAAAGVDGWQDRLDQRLREALRKERVPGAAVVVVDRQGITFQQGYGYADRQARRPVTPATRFPLANATKIVTAILVLQAVQQGRIQLDQPLTSALADVAIDSRFAGAPSPTIRQLLSHHGGLPSNVLAGIYGDRPATRLAPMGDLYLAHPPGTIYSYSNRAYVVLGHLLERLSDRPFADLARQRVFAPLGMAETGFDPRADDARGHKGRGRPSDPLYPRDLAAMGLRGSVEDLGRLLHWVLRADPGPLLNRELRAEMSRVQNSGVPLDLDNRAGLPWQLSNTDGFAVQRAMRMTTGTLQFRGTVIVLPDHGIGLALLANSPESMDFVLDQARRAVDDLLAEKAGFARPERDAPAFPERIALPASASADPVQQRYNTPLGLMAFDGPARRLDIDYLGKAFRATRRDDGWYQLSYRLLGLISLRFNIIREILIRPARIGPHQVLLVYYQGRSFLFGTALNGVPPNPHLEDLAGRYELANPDAFSERLKLRRITLEYEAGVLYAIYKLPLFISLKPRIPLVEHRRNEFYIPGLGTAQGERLIYDPLERTLHFAGYRFVDRR